MSKGKDGFTALSLENGAEPIIDEENGVLISMIIRQYFISLKVLKKWRRGGRIRDLFKGLKQAKAGEGELGESAAGEDNGEDNEFRDDEAFGDDEAFDDDEFDDDEFDDDEFDVNALHSSPGGTEEPENEFQEPEEFRARDLIRRAGLKWARLAGVREHAHEELEVDWTRSVAPRVEGRVCTV